MSPHMSVAPAGSTIVVVGPAPWIRFLTIVWSGVSRWSSAWVALLNSTTEVVLVWMHAQFAKMSFAQCVEKSVDARRASIVVARFVGLVLATKDCISASVGIRPAR